jgi:glycosyltransferase involved in cell wall biosynthesis
MRRILIDGTMAKGGGGFTYLVNILPRLCESAPDHRFRVLVRSDRLAQSIAPAANLEIDLLPEVGWVERLRFTYREIPRLVREWSADLFFSVGESAPLRARCPMIASFRNPIVFTSPDEGASWRERVRVCLLREVARLSSRVCARVMFVSEASATWIGNLLAIPARRRAVVYHGIDAAAWAPAEPTIVRERYILTVGSIYPHKNYVRLIEAYAALVSRRPDVPDLVIVGDERDPQFRAEMERARFAAGEGFTERIHIVGEVPYAEIKACYAGAALFVFPSYLETFGHPLLEAMASGVPVVAADIPAFREVAGAAAIYADPFETKSLASAIEEALGEARAALIHRGDRRVAQFGWERSAQRLLALFDEVLAERARAAQTAIDRAQLRGAWF